MITELRPDQGSHFSPYAGGYKKFMENLYYKKAVHKFQNVMHWKKHCLLKIYWFEQQRYIHMEREGVSAPFTRPSSPPLTSPQPPSSRAEGLGAGKAEPSAGAQCGQQEPSHHAVITASLSLCEQKGGLRPQVPSCATWASQLPGQGSPCRLIS